MSDPQSENESDKSAVARFEVQQTLAELYPGRVVKHKQYGIWDWYEEKNPDPDRFPIFDTLKSSYSKIIDSTPYVVRMIKDVMSIPGCKLQLGIYGVTELALSLIPAVSLRHQSQLVGMMEVALKTGTVDSQQLVYICAGSIGCMIVSMVLRIIRKGAQGRLSGEIRRWSALHSFKARARLDVPTFSSIEVQSQLGALQFDYYDRTAIWQMLQLLTETASKSAHLGAQAFVLFNALRGQQGGTFMILATLVSETMPFALYISMLSESSSAWAVTTRNKAYSKLQGWKTAVTGAFHRKEFVAGNMEDHAVSEFILASREVGDDDRGYEEIRRNEEGYGLMNYLRELGAHLPLIVLTVAACRNQKNMPEALSSLKLLQTATRGFALSVLDSYTRMQSMSAQLSALRNVYEIGNIQNLVPDGTIPFLVDASEETGSGISVEFRNVTFRYPDAKDHALRNVSFTLSSGQLCVIIGSNGAGKSTILKLLVRLYDPEKGQIIIDGHDIRTLKLRDLRRAITVLFQDYTHFPLSIRENIALGDLSGPGNDEHVRMAARLSGADSFIATLPDGLDTFLQRPRVEQCTGPPEGSKTRAGNTFDLCLVRDVAGIRTATTFELSGGQMQRLAVARTFMRSIVRQDHGLGLLLFDEPSASLDPTAEHDLFDRLRSLKGTKTMIFSTHRFGNLTRHADLILYMDKSGIVEAGTHEELLSGEGEYARIWKLQAQAFV